MRKSVDPAAVSDWFALMKAWDEAEADLRRAMDPASSAHEGSKRAIEAAQQRLQDLKLKIDAAIAAGRDDRPTELGANLVVGAISLDAPDAAEIAAEETAGRKTSSDVRLPRRG